ncbi:Transcriptional Regulator, LysR family [Shewanella piezotolerans WP3]|uniref:Transcriptional Regulator, LysR family n=1 Tax=Shewanella piezotolerans (strain WP3 / JCM 13877) TaxID=225849 RepID=B8CUJ1_SHEPW|nr:LysR family transcriptional regulator [Shewanella piezotolerans]ACJ31183.1 Transcriptional Regulator, LysR family [Shewanella piezotolerans WP3]
MLVTPERLTYLVLVADKGSFSAAGREMGVSPSAVAQVIQNMEIDLNIVLFDRVAGKAPQLTAVGKAMYLQALEVIPRLQAMEKRAQAFQAGIEDKLNIAVYGFTLFPTYVEKIAALSNRFPELIINLMDVEDITALSADDVNAADIIIAPTQLKQRHGYDTQIIDQLDWLVVASPSHPLAKLKSRLTYQDLISHRQVITAENLFAEKHLVESLRLSPNLLYCSQFYQIESMLLNGLGFALFPSHLAEKHFAANALVELKMEDSEQQPGWPIELVWSPSLGPAGRWFVEQFVEL